MMMKRNPLPKNADELLAPGEAVAAFLPRTKSNGTSRQKSKRCCGARVRPHSIRFSKVWGGGGRPSLVDARLDPCFFHKERLTALVLTLIDGQRSS
ncbi:MAG TPA: hypothetical protein VER98_01925 [Terriglobia bacterium]|nr:hypothetical protein [Terriglobia bacterium]